PGSWPRADHHGLLHLPRHPGGAGARKARPQPHGRAMFIFYWGMLSSITPPVAIASFAAAGIAGSPAMKTGWESMWVGSIIYFIPFFFVLNPALVLQGDSPYLAGLVYWRSPRSAHCSFAAAFRAIRPLWATFAIPARWNGRCACCY